MQKNPGRHAVISTDLEDYSHDSDPKDFRSPAQIQTSVRESICGLLSNYIHKFNLLEQFCHEREGAMSLINHCQNKRGQTKCIIII